MALNDEQLEELYPDVPMGRTAWTQYLRRFGDRNGVDPSDMDRSLSPEPLALTERPRFDSLAGNFNGPRLRAEADIAGDRSTADDIADVVGRQLGRDGVPMAAAGVSRAPLLAGRGLPAEDTGSGGGLGYLEALSRAQRADDLANATRTVGGHLGRLVQSATRGAYQPGPVGTAGPGEVEKLAQRRAAVAEYLKQQRDAESAAADNAYKLAHAEWMKNHANPTTPTTKPGLTQKQIDERHAKGLALIDSEIAANNRRGQPNPHKPEKQPAPTKDRGLPASEVKELADFDAATDQLDNLMASFKSLNMDGLGGKLGGKATDILGLQSTDSASYLADARRAMQSVGTILEGGKLAAGDEVKYRRMLPEPGDPPELAQRKVNGLKQLLADLRAKREARFKASGFGDGTGSATPARGNWSDTDEARMRELEARAGGK